MKKMYCLLSHKLTEDQINDAKEKLKCSDFEIPDQKVLDLWKNIEPDTYRELQALPIKKDIISKCNIGDLVLVQGEWGMTYEMVSWCKKNGFVPIYSATKRIYTSTNNSDGSITNTHIFKHISYNEY